MDENATRKRREQLIPLLKDPVEEVRQAAAHSLERLEELGSFAKVTEMLKKGDIGAKIKAIYALGRIGGDEVLPPLFYCATRPEDDIRSAAIEALGMLADPRTLPALKKHLQEPNTAIQVKAIAALGNCGAPEAAALLTGFLDAGDGFLDAEAAKALGVIGSAELEDKFLSLLASPHPATREAAAFALSHLPFKR